MRTQTVSIAVAACLAISACEQSASNSVEGPVTNDQEEVTPIPPPATAPDARTPLGQPSHQRESKSVEAAAQVVRDYAELMEHHRLDEAANLWTDKASAADFAKQLPSEMHVEIGKLGQTEGAAGSIYTTVPVLFSGESYRKPANVILRRINDVPGSTEEQRHWHIERVDWKSAD